MKKRCCNERDPTYHDYGERGIKVCQEWLDDFGAFYNWAINNGYQDNLTIDRIDVNKGYEPDNCSWADRYTQNVNTRRELYGWSFEDSVLTPRCKDRSYKRYSNYEQY